MKASTSWVVVKRFMKENIYRRSGNDILSRRPKRLTSAKVEEKKKKKTKQWKRVMNQIRAKKKKPGKGQWRIFLRRTLQKKRRLSN